MIEAVSVLVVDDHPLFRAGVVHALAAEPGITVAGEAASGEEALRLARERLPDVVLLDISMPGLSGEDTCARLRATPQGAAMHIVAYTAHAFPEDRERLLANGFDDTLIKPISRQRIEELITHLG